jgi:hypothetical protein
MHRVDRRCRAVSDCNSGRWSVRGCVPTLERGNVGGVADSFAEEGVVDVLISLMGGGVERGGRGVKKVGLRCYEIEVMLCMLRKTHNEYPMSKAFSMSVHIPVPARSIVVWGASHEKVEVLCM